MEDKDLNNLLPEGLPSPDPTINEDLSEEFKIPKISKESLDLADLIVNNTKEKENKLSLTKEEKLLTNTFQDDLKDVFGTGKIDVGGTDIESDSIRKTLNNGDSITKFEEFTPNIDNEDNLAIKQSWGEQLVNGVSKATVKTALNILDGTVGTVGGLIEGISKGSFSAIYNNGFSKLIDDLNTELDYNLPNYYTQEERSMDFIESLGTTNFWANDVLGGMSFMVGAIGSEAIWGAATGGASLSTALQIGRAHV